MFMEPRLYYLRSEVTDKNTGELYQLAGIRDWP